LHHTTLPKLGVITTTLSSCHLHYVGPVVSSITDGDVDWASAADALCGQGWVRLKRAVSDHGVAELVEGAPDTWEQLPEYEASVRQGGLTCHIFFRDAPSAVQRFGEEIRSSLMAAQPEVPPIPHFNEVQWARSQDGVGFITAHRDPPGVGGIIAILTIQGHALFRVLEGPTATEWETEDRDLVLLRGRGWPNDESLCPVHEVESPRRGERLRMTLRHNLGGPGADYFA